MCVGLVVHYLEDNTYRILTGIGGWTTPLTSKSSPQRSHCRVSSGLGHGVSRHGGPCASSFPQADSRCTVCLVCAVYLFIFRKPDKKAWIVPAFSHYFLFCVAFQFVRQALLLCVVTTAAHSSAAFFLTCPKYLRGGGCLIFNR